MHAWQIILNCTVHYMIYAIWICYRTEQSMLETFVYLLQIFACLYLDYLVIRLVVWHSAGKCLELCSALYTQPVLNVTSFTIDIA